MKNTVLNWKPTKKENRMNNNNNKLHAPRETKHKTYKTSNALCKYRKKHLLWSKLLSIFIFIRITLNERRTEKENSWMCNFFWWNRLVAFILAQPSNEQLRSKNIYRQLKKGWFSWVIAHGKTEEYFHQAETPCKECITESHLNHLPLRFFGRFFLVHVVIVTRHKTANQTCSE